MKRWVCGLLCVACALALGCAAAEEVVIDVVDGRFIAGGYELDLADALAPIIIGKETDGSTFVQVETSGGVESIRFGEAELAMTQSALPYVTLVESSDQPALSVDGYDTCPVCGRSTAIGRHHVLSCGHWGCLVPADHPGWCTACERYTCDGADHTRCDSCGVKWCVHVDLECEHTRNPAPEPYAVVSPEGERSYYTHAENGSYYEGDIMGEAAKAWSPGSTFIKAKDPGLEEGDGAIFISARPITEVKTADEEEEAIGGYGGYEY